MANTNIGNYVQAQNSMESGFAALNKSKDLAFSLKEKGLDTAKTLGEAKVFLSGKPVSKFLYSKGRKMAGEAIDRGMKDLSDFRDAYQTNRAADFADAQFAKTPIQMGEIGDVESESVDTIGRGMGENALSNSGYGNINEFTQINRATNSYPASSDYDNAFDVDEFANTGILRNPTYEEFSGNARASYENAFDEDNMADNSLANTAHVTEEDPIYDNLGADLGRSTDALVEGVGKTVAVKAGESAAGAAVEAAELPVVAGLATDAVGGIADAVPGLDAIADAIPGADIIGVIAGAALAIRSGIKAHMLNKSHDKPPVDQVNSSFQVGI